MASPNATLPAISVQFAFSDLSTGTTPAPFSPRTIPVNAGFSRFNMIDYGSTVNGTPLALSSVTPTTLPVSTPGNFSPTGGTGYIDKLGARGYSFTYTGISGVALTGVLLTNATSLTPSVGDYVYNSTLFSYVYLGTSTIGNFSPNGGTAQFVHSANTTTSAATALSTSAPTSLPVTDASQFQQFVPAGSTVNTTTITHGATVYTVSYTGVSARAADSSQPTITSSGGGTIPILNGYVTGLPTSGSITANVASGGGLTPYRISYTGISGGSLTGCTLISGGTTVTLGFDQSFIVNQLNNAQIVSGGANFTTTSGVDVVNTAATTYSINYTTATYSSGQGSFLAPQTNNVMFYATNPNDYIKTWNWYEAGTYVREFQTRMGRQHELDRPESSSMQLGLESRDGRWFPWNTATFNFTSVTTGSTDALVPNNILEMGVPIKILATWNGVQYPVYFGYADSWEPSAPDEVNSDTTVICSDILKRLALSRLSSSTSYQSAIAASLSVGYTPDLVRLNDLPTSSNTAVSLQNTGVSGILYTLNYPSTTLSATSSATVQFWATGTFSSSSTPVAFPANNGTFQMVHIGNYYTVAYATSSSSAGGGYLFTGCRLVTGSSTSFSTSAGDYIVGGVGYPQIYSVGTATLNGQTTTAAVSTSAFGKQGPIAFDPNSRGIDLSNGTGSTPQLGIGFTNSQTAYTSISNAAYLGNGYTMEGWYQNAIAGDTLWVMCDWSTAAGSSIGYAFVAQVSTSGNVTLSRQNVGTGGITTTSILNNQAGPTITDGNWHLVTMNVTIASGTLLRAHLFVDGIYCGNGTIAQTALKPTNIGWGVILTGTFNSLGPGPIGGTAATVSDIAFALDNGTSTTPGNFATNSFYRYTNGTRFRDTIVSTQVVTSTVINNVTTVTVPVVNSSGFLNGGGLATAVVAGVNYPFSYTGISNGNLLGVRLFPSATGTPTTLTLPIPCSIYHSQGVSSSLRIKQAAEVVGLVSSDGYATPTSPPLNLSTPVVKQTTPELSTTFNTSALDYILQYNDTENGYVYQDNSGTIQFLPRFYPQTHAQNSVQFTDNATTNQAHYLPQVEIVQDDLDTWTVAQITSANAITSTSQNNSAVAQFGPRTLARGQNWSARQTDVDAQASLITYRYQQPITRPRKVVIESTYADGTTQPNQAVQLGTNLWDQVVFNRSAYGANYSQTVVVESISHDYQAEPGRWRTSYVLSPYEMNGSSTVNSGSFFQLSTSTGAADYSKFQTGQSNVAVGTTLSTTGSALQVNDATSLPASGTVTVNHSGTNISVPYTAKVGPDLTSGSTIAGNLAAMAVDSSDNLYWHNGGTIIYKRTPNGVTTTYASNALLGSLAGNMAFDSSGNLFACRFGQAAVVKITTAGVVTTFSSGGLLGVVAGANPYPNGLAIDGSNNLYVTNWGSGVLVKITSAAVQSSFATGTIFGSGVCRDAAGNFYVSGSGLSSTNSQIYIVSSAGGAFSVFATLYNNPVGSANSIVYDSVTGNLITSTLQNGPFVITSSAGVTNLPSFPQGQGNSFPQNGQGFGLAIDSKGNLYSGQTFAGIGYSLVGYTRPLSDFSARFYYALTTATVGSGTQVLSAGDTITYATGTAQDTFGG
jgi:hypothetical protein